MSKEKRRNLFINIGMIVFPIAYITLMSIFAPEAFALIQKTVGSVTVFEWGSAAAPKKINISWETLLIAFGVVRLSWGYIIQVPALIKAAMSAVFNRGQNGQ